MENDTQNESTGFDLAEIQPQARTVDIVHPSTNYPIGLSITILPPSSPEVKRAQRKNLDAQLSARSSKITAAGVEQNSLNLLVACVGAWEWKGDSNFKGNKPPCTPENVRELFTEVSWIREQVKDEFDDAESFFDA